MGLLIPLCMIAVGASVLIVSFILDTYFGIDTETMAIIGVTIAVVGIAHTMIAVWFIAFMSLKG